VDTRDQAQILKRKLELIVRTGLMLTPTGHLPTMLQGATDAGRELCEAQFGAFFCEIVDAQGESAMVQTASGIEREKLARFGGAEDLAALASSFKGGPVTRSGDVSSDPNFAEAWKPFGETPVRSLLAVRVQDSTGEVLGGLFFGHAEVDAFDSDCESLASTVAVQASTAIENVRLREELRRKMADLEETEHWRADAVKRLAELAAIVESSDDAILSKDLTGRIITWNEAAQRIFGYTAEEMVGESILRLIPAELQSEEKTILEKIRSGERIDHFETVRLTKTGERLDVLLSISPVRDATGTVVGASKILRDVTQRRRMTESLLQAEKIAAAGRMAATIAHEINNPLEAVVNLIFLAKADATDPQQIAYLDSAEGEVERVSHIARQTLGFYREHAAAVLTDVAQLTADALKVYGPRCRAAGIEIQADLRATRQVVLRRGEFMQVISNLLANSIYAMPNGGTLTVTVKDGERSDEGVVVSVRDTGVGIPAEQLPHIFDAFYTTRGTIGTGIGLFVARQFVEGHGGRISVTSSTSGEERGTRMKIVLPRVTTYGAENGPVC
jgi:PAS domain S-box-containing protein